MHNVRNITEDLYWVGGNDRRLALFENIHPIPRGVSYNAYLLPLALWPGVAVLVTTVRALKMHGGVAKDALAQENLPALTQGLANLQRHLHYLRELAGLPCVVEQQPVSANAVSTHPCLFAEISFYRKREVYGDFICATRENRVLLQVKLSKIIIRIE